MQHLGRLDFIRVRASRQDARQQRNLIACFGDCRKFVVDRYTPAGRARRARRRQSPRAPTAPDRDGPSRVFRGRHGLFPRSESACIFIVPSYLKRTIGGIQHGLRISDGAIVQQGNNLRRVIPDCRQVPLGDVAVCFAGCVIRLLTNTFVAAVRRSHRHFETEVWQDARVQRARAHCDQVGGANCRQRAGQGKAMFRLEPQTSNQ